MKDNMAVKDFFNSLADEWDECIPPVLPARSAIAVLSGAHTGSRILDIACGTGIMEPELLALGTARIEGIDISDGMIGVARKKFADDERVHFTAADLLDYSCGERFDAAVLYNAYPHFQDKAALLEKVASLLAEGGRFTVAHGMGRAKVNAHHGGVSESVAARLRPAIEEAEAWKGRFEVDTLVDTPEIYVISGVLK